MTSTRAFLQVQVAPLRLLQLFQPLSTQQMTPHISILPHMPVAEPSQPQPKGRRSSEIALSHQQSRQPRRRNSLATTAIIENPPSAESLNLCSLPKYNLYIPDHKVRSSHVKLNVNMPSSSTLSSKDDTSDVVIIPRRSLRSLVNKSREFSPAKYHVHDVAQSLCSSLNIAGMNTSNDILQGGDPSSWNPPTSLMANESPSSGVLGKLADEDDQPSHDKYYLVDVGGKYVDIDSIPGVPDISVSTADVSQSSLQDSGYSLALSLPESVPPNDLIDKEKIYMDGGSVSQVKMGLSSYPSDQSMEEETQAHATVTSNRGLIPIDEISVSREGIGEASPMNDSNETDPRKNIISTIPEVDSTEGNYGNEDPNVLKPPSPSHSSFTIQNLVHKLFHSGPHRDEEDDELDRHRADGEIPLKKSSLVYKIFHPGMKEPDDDHEHGHPRSGLDDTGHETDVDEREHGFQSKLRKKKKKRSFVDKILHPHHPHGDLGERKEHNTNGQESDRASTNVTDSEQSKRHSSSSLENGLSDVDSHKKTGKLKSSGSLRNLFGRFSLQSGSSDGEATLSKGKNERENGSSDEGARSDAHHKGDGALSEDKLQKRQSKKTSGRRRRPPPLPGPPESDRVSSSENISSQQETASPVPHQKQKKNVNSNTSPSRKSKHASSEDTEIECADDSTQNKNRNMIASLEGPDGHVRPFFHKFLLNQSYLRPSSTPVSPSGRLSPRGSPGQSGEDPSAHLEDHQIPEFEALPEPSHTYDHAKEFFKEFIHGSPHRRRSHTFSGHVQPGSSSPKPAFLDDHDLYEKYGVCDEVLGKGANGTVRLAHKKTTVSEVSSTPNEKLFAVKRFRKRRKGENEKEYIKKLTSEFCISSNLHHVNIVETVDLIEDENLGWCEVMEYLPGGNLFDKIATSGELDVFEINCYFRQLINGVTYLHSVGVAHRDLKPENLLLDANGCILKIADFGVSEVFRIVWETKSRKLKGLAGSEPYIAPEEFTIQEYDPTKVDVWACGIIYYTMVHHSVPFLAACESDELYKTFLKNRLGSYPPIDNLADGPKRMLNAILDPNPDTRTSMEGIRDDAWFAAIDHCTTERKGRYHTHSVCKPGGEKSL